MFAAQAILGAWITAVAQDTKQASFTIPALSGQGVGKTQSFSASQLACVNHGVGAWKRMRVNNALNTLEGGTAVSVILPDQANIQEAVNRLTTMPVKVNSVNEDIVEFRVVGISPLIVQRWSEKSKRQMSEKQQGRQFRPRAPKKPLEEAQNSAYYLSDGSHGIPALALKKAAVGGCRYVDGVTMVTVRGLFFVLPDEPETGLVRLKAPEPIVREDMVRNQNGVADVRYRYQYWPWECAVRVLYDKKNLTIERLLSLFVQGGWHVGIGERRPEKLGDDFGRFTVRLMETE
jgi:hypothetical protein